MSDESGKHKFAIPKQFLGSHLPSGWEYAWDCHWLKQQFETMLDVIIRARWTAHVGNVGLR
ncbi:hypothetical protein BPAE_0060g00310 [Botrytis paeoniae]|uniref:Uncharacterized protein n=1 Tax=Botrytis paeoniae TaxID=278948 RepID=A0A4Z1FPI5_9HELO|nr:hypothetical protein BPAE_0060g00310 [Botrytis paeoniae]